MKQKKVLLLLGPNLNLVGIREKGVYGQETAAEIEQQVVEYAQMLGCHCARATTRAILWTKSMKPGSAMTV